MGSGPGSSAVVSVLVIADLTRGTGRFNLTLGAITTVVGIGAALSQFIAGSMVHHLGDRRAYFRTCVTVLIVVLVGYFLVALVGVEPYVVAFAGSGVLAIAGFATGWVQVQASGEPRVGRVPFRDRLFSAVRGLENLGIVGLSSRWFAQLVPEARDTPLVATGALRRWPRTSWTTFRPPS